MKGLGRLLATLRSALAVVTVFVDKVNISNCAQEKPFKTRLVLEQISGDFGMGLALPQKTGLDILGIQFVENFPQQLRGETKLLCGRVAVSMNGLVSKHPNSFNVFDKLLVTTKGQAEDCRA